MSANILIIGKGGCGKDTAAEIICSLYGLSFVSSSRFACKKCIFPVLAQKYGYQSYDQCYEDRRNHREEWKELISAYNSPDKSKLARELLKEFEIYVGMRCPDEFEAAKELFQEIYYIDADERVLEDDPTFKIPFDPACMVRIDNNGSLRDLTDQIEEIFD